MHHMATLNPACFRKAFNFCKMSLNHAIASNHSTWMCVHVVRGEKSADAVSCNSEDIACNIQHGGLHARLIDHTCHTQKSNIILLRSWRVNDNLRKEDKSSAPKVSFIRRFHCNYKNKAIRLNSQHDAQVREYDPLLKYTDLRVSCRISSTIYM